MSFTINATDLQWINGKKDDPNDLCLHGHAVVNIAGRVLEYTATVSATALYLLKTLTEDHIIKQDNQMLPCCGNTLIADEELNNISISGCDNGIDWSVRHEGDVVVIELEDGTKDSIPIDVYTDEVFRFVDMIEDFYNTSMAKVVPDDDFERNGYTAFWNEWHRRRGK